jgi:formylglycine-generating enzyme required for sulfatase activity
VAACGSGSVPPEPVGENMVSIPTTRFHMGCYHDDGSICSESGTYAHDVDVLAFRIDRMEVTVAAYRRCVAASECTPLREPPKLDDSFPALVDWPQGDMYCRWRGARLPAESEWELAARGTDGRNYPWGNTPPTCADIQFRRACENADLESLLDRAGLAPVGTHPRDRSPYGVMDLAGNAAEWVADEYDPPDPSAAPKHNRMHVVRGDTVSKGPPCCVVFSREEYEDTLYGVAPGKMENRGIGFRCASVPVQRPR